MPWHLQDAARDAYTTALAGTAASNLSPEQRELRQALGLSA